MSTRSFDVAVIGAGTFGAWIAYRLQRSGKRVVLVDAFGPGNSRSSSGDESRIIRMGYGGDALYTQFALKSLRAWIEIFERMRRPHLFQRTGVLWMGPRNDERMRGTVRSLQQAGVTMEEFSGAEAHRRFPQFDTDGIEWATLEPESGALMARQAVGAVVDAYLEEGGHYQPGKAAPLRQGAKLDSVTLENGDHVAAGTYVFACGPWLPKLFPEILAKRMFVTRQEVFYLAAPKPSEFTSPQLPVWYHQAEQGYGFPDLEYRGVKVAFDIHGPAFDPDTGDRIVTDEGLRQMRAYLTRRIPVLARVPVAETRVCQYENTSNGDFLIDRHPEADHVWLAGGGSGHGFKHGPAVAEYLAAQLDGTGKPEPRFSLASKETVQKRTVF